MQITLIYIGETSEKFFSDASEEYEKRLKRFCEFKAVCIKPEKLNDSGSVSQAMIDGALEAESKRIVAAIPKGAYKIALCIEGKQLDTASFASMLQEKSVTGVSKAVFIIGSSHGLANSVKKECDTLLSMSKMTFPHQLARVMLTEQIYRAFNLTAGGKYHK